MYYKIYNNILENTVNSKTLTLNYFNILQTKLEVVLTIFSTDDKMNRYNGGSTILIYMNEAMRNFENIPSSSQSERRNRLHTL